jgi:hypothetical protein
MDDELEPMLARKRVAEVEERPELPGGVDMEQRERRAARKEGAQREMLQHRRVLARREQHHWLAFFGDRFAQDMDRFGFQARQMREPRGHAAASHLRSPA